MGPSSGHPWLPGIVRSGRLFVGGGGCEDSGGCDDDGMPVGDMLIVVLIMVVQVCVSS
jgi:hypothetical protein